MADPLGLQPWQWGAIALAWVVFFVVPSFWMWKRAKQDGDNAFVWTALVLVGSFMGIYEYFHHRSILKRREKRAERQKAKTGQTGQPPEADGGER